MLKIRSNNLFGMLCAQVYAIIGVSRVAYAQFRFRNPIEAGSFAAVVEKIADLLVQIGLPVAVIFLVWSGFLFVSARGDEKQLETAKSTFKWTVLGAGLIVGAWAIAEAVVNFAEQL